MRPIVKTYRLLWIPFLAALIPFLITSASVLALLLSGEATQDELAVPFVGMSAMSIAVLLALGIPLLVLGLWERAAIMRLVNESHWAKWPQFNSEQEWRTFAEAERTREIKDNPLPWGTFIMLLVIFTGISGFMYYLMNSSPSASGQVPTYVFIPLGVFFTLILIFVMGMSVAGRRRSEALYRRRLNSPIPNVYFNGGGFYDEDSGFETFRYINRWLTGVNIREGAMTFSVTIRRGSWIWRTMLLTAKIPPGKEAEAEALRQRFVDEGLILSPKWWWGW
jgi:hypothetical protein